MAYLNHALSICSFIAFLLVLSPLPWHLKGWNTGTCCFMIWSGLGCLNQFINSIVWNGNTTNWAPVWCDISIKIWYGVSVALPAAVMCISRRLYLISSARAVQVKKYRVILEDLGLSLGIPLLMIGLNFIPQGHRFDILEDIGCWPPYYNTVPAIIITSMPPVIIGIPSTIYAVINFRTFYKRQVELRELFASNNTGMNSAQYTRLMGIGIASVFITNPLAIWVVYINAKLSPIYPWS